VTGDDDEAPAELDRSPLGPWLTGDSLAWPVLPAWPVLHRFHRTLSGVLRDAPAPGPPDEARAVALGFVRSVADDCAQVMSRAVVQDIARSTGGDSVPDWCSAIRLAYRSDAAATRFLADHPILRTRLRRVLAAHLDSFRRMVSALAQDADAVRELSGAPSVRLRAVAALGDLHQRGAVLKLTFGSGHAVMYKPRSLAVEGALPLLCRHLAASDAGISVGLPRVLDRTRYGWQQFVAAEDLGQGTAGRFYANAGGLLALAFLLGGADLHCDNVVCVGEVPTLLDAECFFDVPDGTGAGSDPLLSTGLLPDPGKPAGAPDVTCLGSFGTDQARRRWTVPVSGPGSSPRLATYTEKPFRPVQLPSRDGRCVPPGDHAAEVVEGYRRTYEHFRACGTCPALIATITSTLSGAPVRHLFRSTAEYGRMLHALSDGRAARSAPTAQRYVDSLPAARLASGAPGEPVAQAEKSALSAGHIPRFERPVAGRTVTDGLRLDHPAVAVSGAELARRRLDALGPAELERHCDLIRRSLASLSDRTAGAPPA
jgi:lantibiotic modifying enzyme